MDSQRSHQGEAGSLDKLLFPPAPLHCLTEGEGRPIEEAPAAAIADVSGVEVLDPALHLLLGDLSRVVHHRGQLSGLVNAGGPELLSEGMVFAELLG